MVVTEERERHTQATSQLNSPQMCSYWKPSGNGFFNSKDNDSSLNKSGALDRLTRTAQDAASAAIGCGVHPHISGARFGEREQLT